MHQRYTGFLYLLFGIPSVSKPVTPLYEPCAFAPHRPTLLLLRTVSLRRCKPQSPLWQAHAMQYTCSPFNYAGHSFRLQYTVGVKKMHRGSNTPKIHEVRCTAGAKTCIPSKIQIFAPAVGGRSFRLQCNTPPHQMVCTAGTKDWGAQR